MFRRFMPEVRRRNEGTPQARRPSNLLDWMDELWRAPFEMGALSQIEYPAINISEDEKEIKVQAELPGLESKDVDISLQNNNLILQGEKKFEDEERRDDFHRIERSYGSFYRSIPLPVKVDEDNIKAQLKNGILDISLPKQEEVKGKKIQIES